MNVRFLWLLLSLWIALPARAAFGPATVNVRSNNVSKGNVSSLDFVDPESLTITGNRAVITPGAGGGVSDATLVTASNAVIAAFPVVQFTNIAQMVASTRTNIIAEVPSYYGTNDLYGRAWGGGRFIWKQSSATADLGTVFAHSVHGRWVRIQDDPNVFHLAWWGVLSARSPDFGDTYFDSSVRVQNCIDSIPNYSKVWWPDMRVVANPLITNRTSLTFIAESQPQGARNGLVGPYLCFNGPTNTPALRVYDSAYITWDGIAVAMDTPMSTPTNHANVAIDVDKTTNAVTSTTGFRLYRTFIYNRLKGNTNNFHLALSRTGLVNTEDTRVVDLTVFGSGGDANWQDNQTNAGPAIFIGNSDNAYEEVFDGLNLRGVSVGVRQLNGGITIKNVYTYMLPRIYEITAHHGATQIENDHSELAEQWGEIRSGDGAVSLTGSTYNDNPSITTTNPFFIVSGVSSGRATLTVKDCDFSFYDWRKVYAVSPGVAFMADLTSIDNHYFQATNIGWFEFDHLVSVNDYVAPFTSLLSKGLNTHVGAINVSTNVTITAPTVDYAPLALVIPATGTALRITDATTGTFRFSIPSAGLFTISGNEGAHNLAFGGQSTDGGAFTERLRVDNVNNRVTASVEIRAPSISYSSGGNARDANLNYYVTNGTGIDANSGSGTVDPITNRYGAGLTFTNLGALRQEGTLALISDGASEHVSLFSGANKLFGWFLETEDLDGYLALYSYRSETFPIKVNTNGTVEIPSLVMDTFIVGTLVISNLEYAASNFQSVDGTNVAFVVMTNRLTTHTALQWTNFSLGQTLTAKIKGESAGGVVRNITNLFGPTTLLRTNGGPYMLSGALITLPPTTNIEINVSIDRETPTNVIDVVYSYKQR